MMKKKFPGYYRPSNEEFNRIWKQALFVFDTNVLLDLYRLSERSSNELFNVLNAIRENIWIPYQVSKEYHKNLNEVIKGQAEKYSDSLKQLEKFKNVIEEKRNHPFLEDEMLNEFTALCARIEDTLSKKGEKVRNLIIENPIKENLAQLFENKVGDSFDDKELECIRDEGRNRYKNAIPPGYKDEKKADNQKFGDLILWKEILQKSKTEKKPIIFVTSDIKEDWFLKVSGMIVGPLPELTEEFIKETDCQFYSYPLDQFLTIASQRGLLEIHEDAIEEIEERIQQSSDKEQYSTNDVGNSNQELNTTDDCFNNSKIEAINFNNNVI